MKLLFGQASKVQEEMTNRYADKETELKKSQEEKQQACEDIKNLMMQKERLEDQNEKLAQQLAQAKEKLADVTNRYLHQKKIEMNYNFLCQHNLVCGCL